MSMRVLILSPCRRPRARLHAESLRALGAEVLLLTSDISFESDSRRDYERVLLGRPVPTADWTNLARAYRAALRFKPDIVVTEMLRDPRWRIFAGLAPRVRFLHDDKPHDKTHERTWWRRTALDNWEARGEATVVFSQYVAEQVRAQPHPPRNLFVAPLCSDLDPAMVPQFVPATGRRNFLLLGRQRPYKNHPVVFAAWERHCAGPHWQGDELVLMGRGDVPVPLPPHARWVRTAFRYEDVVGALAAAKGSIVHSRSASQSGVQALSMQLGVATLVSTAGSLPEHQPPGHSVTGVDDVAGLARAMDDLADPATAESLGRQARAHYVENFDRAIASAQLLEIFEEVRRRSAVSSRS